MASSDQPRKKGQPPRGVRGPGGPPSTPAPGPSQPARSRGWGPLGQDTSSMAPTPFRRKVEAWSYPLLATLHRLPRWIVVIAPALLLFLGLVLTGPLAWLGGLMLLIVWLFVAWLTLLSWPAIGAGQRIFRIVVVIALLGVVIVKFLGRF